MRDKDISVFVKTNVVCSVVNHAPFVTNSSMLPKRKGVSPLSDRKEIKCVESAFIADHCLSVPNVLRVTIHQRIGICVQKLWQTWAFVGANHKIRPALTRGLLIISGYANPLRKSYLQ